MKNKLKGKFVIAFDTIVDGWNCAKDDKGKPVLYNSYNEAFKEMFGDNLSMLQGRSKAELKEHNEGVTPSLVKHMEKLYNSGEIKLMEIFFDLNPQCNDNNDFIVPANEYVDGRKAMFTGKGIIIEGTPAKKFF